MKSISSVQLKVLRRAAVRRNGTICPIVDVRIFAGAEDMVLAALKRRGLIFYPVKGIPVITGCGRIVAQQLL